MNENRALADRKASQAFAIYAAHIRAARAAPALLGDPQWQATRDETFGKFLTAFGVEQ